MSLPARGVQSIECPTAQSLGCELGPRDMNCALLAAASFTGCEEDPSTDVTGKGQGLTTYMIVWSVLHTFTPLP